MLTSFVLAAGLLAALPQTLAYNPIEDRRLCQDNRLCLTSFVWCAESTPNNPGGCDYPEGSYSLFDRGYPSNPAGLPQNRDWNLTWAYSGDYPVRIRWFFDTDVLGNQSNNRTGYWEQNVTGTSYTMNFANIISSFPLPGNDYQPEEVRGLASALTDLQISQPDRPVPASNSIPSSQTSEAYFIDSAQSFVVMNSFDADFIETASDVRERSINRRWRLGVGIGVGLGVPLLMAMAFGGGWFWGKRKAPQQVPHSKMSTSS